MQIGAYEILEELARGGMGVVYRARHETLPREVAIKLLLAGRDASVQQRKRFERESRALLRLRHRNVIAVLDGGEHQGSPYLVLELVEGETLEDRLRREGPLPHDEAAAIVEKLARAVEHAHSQGVLHRDLKPTNVLVDGKTGEPKLTDFGLTRDLTPDQSRLSKTGAFLGTPGYWPPEQAQGQLDRIGPTSDVYGLGATLYALLTGQSPHAGSDSLVDAVVSTARATQPPSRLRRGIPSALDRVCLRALAHEPSQRYPSASALAEALVTAGEGGGTLRSLALAGGVVLLGAVVAAGLLFTRAASPSAASPQPSTSTWPTPEVSAAEGAEIPPAQAQALELVRQGYQLNDARQFEQARRVLDRAIELAPDLADAFAQRGLARWRLEAADEAVADFNRAIELDPEHPFAHLKRGVAFSTRGELQKALDDFVRAGKLDPDLAPAHYNAGITWKRLDDLQPALDALNHAIDLNPDLPEVFCARGQTLLALKRYEEAVGDLEEAIRRDPTHMEALRHLVLAHEGLLDLPAAVAALTRAVEIDENHAGNYHNRGALRLRQGDLQGALADYTRAIELGPNTALSYMDRGTVFSKLGQHEEGLADLARASELDPENPRSFLMRGHRLLRLGRSSEAARVLDLALELDPDNAIGLTDRGTVRHDLGDLPGALADLNRAVELDPRAFRAYANRGLLQERMGRLAEALVDLRLARENGADPKSDAELETHIRRVEAALGEGR